jgi:hypothetical protein
MGKMLPIFALSSIGLGYVLGLFWQERGVEAVVDAEGAGVGSPTSNGDVNGDWFIDLSDAIYIFSFLFQGGPAPKPIVCPPPWGTARPPTGQTNCYDKSGTVIDCASALYPGQDAAYQGKNCPREGRFVDNGDGTVSDTCTGLMWQQGTAPGRYNWGAALDYCYDLRLAGYRDWRLPNIREIQSLVDYGRVRPAIDPVFLSMTASGAYWSSTSHESIPDFSWYLNFYTGFIGYTEKRQYPQDDLFVRAVREKSQW